MPPSGRARRRRRTIKAFQNSVPKGPPPEAGDRAPDVRLLDHRGGGGFLSQALRGKGAVLLFLPSAADPAGQAMLRAFAAAFPRLEAQVNVFAVTAQPAARNAA
ncbi:MAG: redoxin domain-containing protein, partial [Kiloniellales bacterium]|nr:redoxin domain-containing protein [Kiloniellales bacterium]